MRRFPVLITIIGLGLTAILAAPARMLNPGELTQGHSALRDDCLSCHSLLRGTPAASCVVCHDAAEVDAKRVGPALHRALSSDGCTACHTDHRGSDPRSATIRFVHGALREDLGRRCESCHQEPRDDLHAEVGRTCAPCHGTDRWTLTAFDHDASSKETAARCVGCHTKPADSTHASVEGRCALCHGTDDWGRISFDHDTYFRFDRRHRVDCVGCHTTGNLDQYTCYACHEHSERNVAHEHREEGIRSFERCVECHRSGSEREAKRRWRKLRRRRRSNADARQESDKRSRKKTRRRRKHDEHDSHDDD